MADDKKPKCKYAGKEECPVADYGYPEPGKVAKAVVEKAKKCEWSKQYACPYLLAYYYEAPDTKQKKEELASFGAELLEDIDSAGLEELAVIESVLADLRDHMDDELAQRVEEAIAVRKRLLNGESVERVITERAAAVFDKGLAASKRVRFEIGPLEQVNENGRYYPISVVEEGIELAQERFKRGKALSLVGHPPNSKILMPDIDEVVARVDEMHVEHRDGAAYIAGTLTWLDTEASRQLRSLIEQGVTFDLSTRALGVSRLVEQDGKSVERVEKWEPLGVDFVLEGGFPAQRVVFESRLVGVDMKTDERALNEQNEQANDNVQAEDQNTAVSEQPQQPQQPADQAVNESQQGDPAAEEQAPAQGQAVDESGAAPQIDVSQIRRIIYQESKESIVEESVRKACEELGLPEHLRPAFAKSVGLPDTPEELQARLEQAKEVYKTIMETAPDDLGLTEGSDDADTERLPSSVDEVIERFADGVPHPDEFKIVLENLVGWRDTKFYVEVHTAAGRRRYEALMETTTTADLVYVPAVLPMIRLVWSQLQLQDLVYTLPIKKATGRVPRISVTAETGGYDLTTYAQELLDAQEGGAKPQIKLGMDYVDFQVQKKAAAFEWSDEAEEDMQAEWGLNVPNLLRNAAISRLALEINIDLLSALQTAANNSGVSVTFGTTPPSNTQADAWYTVGFAQHVAKLASSITDASSIAPTWILCGSNVAVLLRTLNDFKSSGVQHGQVGKLGFAQVGRYQDAYDVYVVQSSFFDANTMIMGSTPSGDPEEALTFAGVVWMPYQMGKLTQVQVDAFNNKLARGISSRYAVVTLRNSVYGKLVVSNTNGTWPVA